jgi:L-cysteine/cystine lyase
VTFSEARALFPVLDSVAYLNAGTFGPLPRPVAQALAAGIEHDLAYGRVGKPYFEQTLALRAEARAALARLVGAEPEQLGLTASTSEGCAIVLRGLGLTADDEIVTTTDEHFGLLGPLGASPARVVVVPPEPERIASAVTPRTRLIATSRVLWTTGATLPLRELREQTGVPVLADGAQSVGAIPDDAHGLDFLTISGQKWLCGPDATGALLVREPDRLALVSPSYFAQTAYGPDGGFEPQPGARRFEAGWWSPGTLRAMLAALALRPDWWFERAKEAAERCKRLLGERFELIAPDAGSTLVSFRVDADDTAALVERLRERQVAVRDIPGRGIVRVSCGWWTSDDDLDRLVVALGDA